MIVVVGIGADGMAGLAPAARAELARATVVHGSPRQLELLDDTVSAPRRPWPSPMLPALRTLLDDADGCGAPLADPDDDIETPEQRVMAQMAEALVTLAAGEPECSAALDAYRKL